MPVQLIAVATNSYGSGDGWRPETVLDRAFPFWSSTSLFGEIDVQTSQLLVELKTASEVVILASLLIAGCSLSGLHGVRSERAQAPVQLVESLPGVPLGLLQRVVALETAAPLIVITPGSAAIGLVSSELFLRGQLGLSLQPPGTPYYLITLGGLVGSLTIIASTLPLLNLITRPEDARIE